MRILLNASFLQKLNTLFERKFYNGSFTFEFFEWILLTDNTEFTGVSVLKTIADVGNKFTKDIKNLKVMFLKLHFHIQTSEFTQVTVSVGVFSSKNWTNFEDFLQITTNSHLLIKLRTLGEASILSEIFKTEYIGTTFRTTSDEFW